MSDYPEIVTWTGFEKHTNCWCCGKKGDWKEYYLESTDKVFLCDDCVEDE